MIKRLLIGSIAVVSLVSTARADIIDFVELTEGTDQLGESGWDSLEIVGSDFVMTITGTQGRSDAYAYLDDRHAGLGVCGTLDTDDSGNRLTGANPNSGTNVCNPGSDDNVTTGEVLYFVFNTNVIIDQIWLNNTHDRDRFIDESDLVNINGTGVAGPGNGYVTGSAYNGASSTTFDGIAASADNYLSNGGSGYMVSAGSTFTIGFNNQQFYVSGMSIRAVPEPGTLTLLGLGLLAAGIARRRKSR